VNPLRLISSGCVFVLTKVGEVTEEDLSFPYERMNEFAGEIFIKLLC
jgi:hypothetical protein